MKANKQRNWVARYARQFNKAAVQKDRKREAKKLGKLESNHG